MSLRFSREELEEFRDASVADLIGPGVKLLFVGINPGLWTAATQTHFAHPGNRFYPALQQAGVIERGVGITNLVNRATVRASELTTEELRDGGRRLRGLVADLQPQVVAIAGITAYRTAFGDRTAQMGHQADDFEGAALWVVPNPSGLNAHETTASLAAWYREVGEASGVVA